MQDFGQVGGISTCSTMDTDYNAIRSDHREMCEDGDFEDQDLSSPYSGAHGAFDMIEEYDPTSKRIALQEDASKSVADAVAFPDQSLFPSHYTSSSMSPIARDFTGYIAPLSSSSPKPPERDPCDNDVDSRAAESLLRLRNADINNIDMDIAEGNASDTSDISDGTCTDGRTSTDMYVEDSAADVVMHTPARTTTPSVTGTPLNSTKDFGSPAGLFSDIGSTPLALHRSSVRRSGGSISLCHSRSNSASGVPSIAGLTIPPYNPDSPFSHLRAATGEDSAVMSPISTSLPTTADTAPPCNPRTAPPSRLGAYAPDDSAIRSILSDTSVLSDGEFTPCVSRQDSEARPLLSTKPITIRVPGLVCGINGNLFVYICVLMVSAVALGYDLGIITIAKDRIGADLDLDADEIQIVTGILNLASAIGGVVVGVIADKQGRRRALLLSGVLQCAGCVVMAFSASFEILCLGRAVVGLGVGGALLAGPLYLAEISPQDMRGALISLTYVFVNVGVALGYAVGYALTQLPLDTGWRWMLGLGGAPTLLVMACIVLMPESPRWLIDVGQIDLASDILDTLYAPEELDMAMHAMRSDRDAGLRSSWRTLCCPPPGWRGLLVVGMFTAFFSQACGIEGAVLYVPQILTRSSDIEEDSDVYLATIGIGVLNAMVAAIASTCVVVGIRSSIRSPTNAAIQWGGHVPRTCWRRPQHTVLPGLLGGVGVCDVLYVLLFRWVRPGRVGACVGNFSSANTGHRNGVGNFREPADQWFSGVHIYVFGGLARARRNTVHVCWHLCRSVCFYFFVRPRNKRKKLGGYSRHNAGHGMLQYLP
eukprot:m.315048 g.315048  ORF g.315048 m.315048 type:complete len:821 (+) comp20275_c0_seq7:213-2675(+)